MKPMFKRVKSFFKLIFDKYLQLAFEVLPKFYRKIPKIIWGSMAFLGIFVMGFLFGLILNDGTRSLAYQELGEKEEKYKDLVLGYEELSTLYKYQGQNMGTIMNLDLYETNPEEILQAIDSTKEYKDRILLQQGRIIELRRQAGYFEGGELDETTVE